MKDILIVEDGTKERERLSKLFTTAGYSVISCDSVQEAEKYLQIDNFRLAILDIGLGDKSGSFLFGSIKRAARVPNIIIFTGNPSVHLKQRFIEEGAVDYLVKGSAQAQNENFLNRVREIIGEAQESSDEGMELDIFLEKYVSESSRKLFLDMDNSLPHCKSCGVSKYKVIFSHQTQVPPQVIGQVVCAGCGKPMDPDVE